MVWVSVKILVSGDVQGVGFRAHAKTCAEQLSLAGYAKNLHDGSVEILAQGSEDAVKKFAGIMKKGPHFSSVKQFFITPFISKKYEDFSIL
ncbi:acylphosphatase [Candidatus Woesearchaeota archaeon]|nr:MAG: acylphosphatase [Candidatus Woesearchaeota archaeon]